MWTVIHNFIKVMPQAYQDAYNEYAVTVTGNRTRYRWKECIDKMQPVFGMPLGLLFVDKEFDERSRAAVRINLALKLTRMFLMFKLKKNSEI